MKHRAEIETLVERFLEGRTTSSEERELYAWFASADVPEEWHDLKAMFAWYSEGMPETLIEDTTSQPALNQDATAAHAPTQHATPQPTPTQSATAAHAPTPRHATPQPTPTQSATAALAPTPRLATPQPTPTQSATTAHAPTPRHASPRRRTIWLSEAAIGTGIAAAIAALLWLTPARPAFDIYEGSYIIEAGVRCDNSDYIRADIEALLKRADNIEQRANMLLAMAD